MLIGIHHETLYRYARPVHFGTHRLLLRPWEGHDVQIRSSRLITHPVCQIRWVHDVFGNSVALADFSEPSSELKIESGLTVEQYNTNPFDFILEPYALEVPFRYADDCALDISSFCARQFPGDEQAIRNWTLPFLNMDGGAKTMDFLIALTRSVPLYFTYSRREEPGVQSPAQTLRQRSGSCRDFALLLMETGRYFGLAARFVTGYLCAHESLPMEVLASGATHAWAEFYLPGAGWKGFDPTCGILSADRHVRVAVTRDPLQAVPITGSFIGMSGDFLGMEVSVKAGVVKGDASPSSPLV